MHRHGLLNDEAIGDELADALAGIGVRDLADLVGVQPNFALAAAQHRRRQALLGPQVNPTAGHQSALSVSLTLCVISVQNLDGDGGMNDAR